jgi:hypothetical protein
MIDVRPWVFGPIAVVLALTASADAPLHRRSSGAAQSVTSARAARSFDALKRSVCAMAPDQRVHPVAVDAWREACSASTAALPSAEKSLVRVQASGLPDGALVGRQRLAASHGVAIDLLAYASDGLVVSGVACYLDDGQAHPTVVHIHGGTEGIFDDPAANMLRACIDWASLHRMSAFLPSLRGQDGGEGRLELCLGEARDVAAGVTLVRSLEFTDAARVGLVGGSIGGCVALKAAPLIPNLRAVVALVPPTDWAGLVAFHRTRFEPAVESVCDGSSRDWNIGGAALADAFDTVICGHASCSASDYESRSPLPGVISQAAPTLIVAAGADNVVPAEQELLWSLMRQQTGHTVQVFVVDSCDPAGTLPSASDVLLFVPGGFHLLSGGAVSSALTFLINHVRG